MATSPNEPSPTASTSSTTSPADLSAFESWRSSLAQMTGLGLTADEQAARAERLDRDRLDADWKKCEKWKANLMRTSRWMISLSGR